MIDGIRRAVEKIKSQVDLSSETSEKELHAELAFQRGNVQMLLGQLDIATKAYSDVFKFTARHADAIKAYSDAIELNPRHVDAYNNRGVIFGIKGEYSMAVKVYCHRKFGPLSKPRLCYNTIYLKGVSDGETKTKNLHP